MTTKFFLTLAIGALLTSSCNSKATSTQQPTETDSITATSNEVVKTIMQRRSIRKYKPQPIEKEKLNQIIECGVYAPNGMGRQSWEVRIVDNPLLLAEIDSTYSAFMSKTNSNAPQKAAFGAPALVFIAYDTRYDLSQVDCGLLGGNMLISAQSMGIGSCCLGGIRRFFNAPEGKKLLERLNFPETHKLLYAIALGYPDESPKAKPRMMEKIKFIE